MPLSKSDLFPIVPLSKSDLFPIVPLSKVTCFLLCHSLKWPVSYCATLMSRFSCSLSKMGCSRDVIFVLHLNIDKMNLHINMGDTLMMLSHILLIFFLSVIVHNLCALIWGCTSLKFKCILNFKDILKYSVGLDLSGPSYNEAVPDNNQIVPDNQTFGTLIWSSINSIEGIYLNKIRKKEREICAVISRILLYTMHKQYLGYWSDDQA